MRSRLQWLVLTTHLKALFESVRSNLFFTPSVYVVAAILLALGLESLDANIIVHHYTPWLTFTVSSARTLVSTVASAIITAASIVFSLAFVAMQLASSQYSPRILYAFLRNRFQQQALGIIVGTFTYSLVVLHGIRSPTGKGPDALVPSLAAVVALVLAIVSAVVLLVYIDFVARSMQVAEIVRRIREDTIATVRRTTLAHDAVREPEPAEPEPPAEPGYEVFAPATGWIQQVNVDVLVWAIPPKTRLRLDTRVGEFVTKGTCICTLWPEPSDPQEVNRWVRLAFHFGASRTMQQDFAFGIRQMTDVAIRALSPSVNAPTTAYEALVEIGAVLHELMLRDLRPRRVTGPAGRVITQVQQLSHADHVHHTFDQIRRFGVAQPAVAVMLLRILAMLKETVQDAGMPERAEPLRQEARLILDATISSGLGDDQQQVLDAARGGGFLESGSPWPPTPQLNKSR